MPEWSEVKIMSEYFNEITENKTFVNVRKSDISKVKTDLKTNSWSLGFTMKSETRGKEFMIKFCRKPECFKHFDKEVMICNMGMSGNWQMTPSNNLPKHAHLIFDTDDGMSVCLVDVRRFARWQWSDGYSTKRGPDPVEDFDNFVLNIRNNINKKIFEKPIYEVLMSQEYFNGLGAYLVAEILGRWDKNPFEPAKEVIDDELLNLCKTVPQEAYDRNGGQLSDWENPYGEDKDSFEDWMLFYQNKRSCYKVLTKKDKRGIWINKKWRQFDLVAE